MENRNRPDMFWRVLSIVLMLMLGAFLINDVYGKAGGPVFYESKKAGKSASGVESHLASISPSIGVNHDSIYWIADLADKALPFVVNIKASTEAKAEGSGDSENSPRDFLKEFQRMLPEGENEDFWQQQMQQQQMPQYAPGEDVPMGEGSGFIIRENGYIVTNAHVVGGADKFKVHFTDGKELDAKLVGLDNFKDIAVLKVEASGLPVAVLGDSESARIGEPVVAIGSPLGYQATVTAGIISTTNRSIEDLGRQADVRKPQKYLQTDAAINRGNSGGPLVNASGEVIGVNQAIARRDYIDGFNWVPIEGIGFAIPINEVKSSIEQIVMAGKVSYPGIQAEIATVSEYVEANKVQLDVEEGVYVARVTVGGPADKAGIKAGDVILTINDNKVVTSQALIEEIMKYKVGERVTVRVARQGGKNLEDVSVVLGELNIEAFNPGE